MRDSVAAALIAVVFWAVLAVLALEGGNKTQNTERETQNTERRTENIECETQNEEPAGTGIACPPSSVPTQEAEISGGVDASFLLPVLKEEEVVSMPLRDYLVGVVLAEMPVSFPEEALKAQAVASRTYALRRYEHRRHEAAAVCTESVCCQAWLDPETADPADRALAEAAVGGTDGLALYYNGALIEATFFACSGGRTEDAAAVWGGELPYLRAVDSPGEEDAAHFTDETRVPLETFRAVLTELDGAVRFPEALGGWVGKLRYTPGGGVDKIELGGRVFTGKQLRKAFGLRSTAFTLELTAGEAVFTTRGYGHRVGMSQYGAAAMARAGRSFVEILEWYYQGVSVAPAG